MAYYYSASERAFFSTDLMTTGAMPSDKVLVDDSTYASLQAAQVAGKIIRTGAAGAPEAVSQSLKTLAGLELDVDLDVEGLTAKSLSVEGSSALSDVNAANLSTSGTLTSKGAANLSGGTTTTTLKATGTSTLAAVNAKTVTASGAIKGASMTATGALVGGSLQITGANATVGGKNIARSVNGVAASSAGDVALPNFEQDGAKSVASPNYNELTEPGFYGCPAAGATNGPGNARKLLVMGLPGAKNFVTQVAFPITEGVCPAIRFLDADGSWTSWGKIALVDSSEELQANRLTSKGGQFRTVMPNLTKGEAPSSTIYSHWSFFDGHGFDYVKNRMGAFQYRTSSDGSSFISMWVNANKANDVTAASLGICVKKDGTVYTYAPTPKDDCDSETEIATAHWARSFGGTTWGLGTVAPTVNSRFGDNDCNSITRTGFYTLSRTANTWSIYGTTILQHIERAYTEGVQAVQITYAPDGRMSVRTREGGTWRDWSELAQRSSYNTLTSGEHYISNANVTFGETPSAVQWTRVLFADKTKTKALGYTGHRYATDGQSRVVMLCYKPDGSGDSASIWVGYDAAGNIKTFAPTPVSSSNDDSIPTTRWVNTKITENRPKAYITETFRSGTSWYRKWSDGFIEQGGYVSNVGYAQAVTVSLLTKMSTPDYTVVLGSSGGQESICRVNGAPTTSSFQIYRQYSGSGMGSGPCFWRVSGY